MRTHIKITVTVLATGLGARSLLGGLTVPIYGGPTYDSSTDTGYLNPDFTREDHPSSSVGDGVAIVSAQKWHLGSYRGVRTLRWNATATAASELGTLGTDISGWTGCDGNSITNSGTAVGYAYRYAGGTSLNTTGALRWSATSPVATELGDLGNNQLVSSEAFAINAEGTAVGYSVKFSTRNLGERAVRWNPSSITATELGTLGTDDRGVTYCRALAISSTGEVVGEAEKYNGNTNLGTRAVRWGSGGTTATELGNLGTAPSGRTDCEPFAVNDSGTVVGLASKYVGGAYLGRRAVRWDAVEGNATELEGLGVDGIGASDSRAYAINSSGTAVGYATKYVNGVNRGIRAVRWAADGTQPIELGSLVPDDGNSRYSIAYAVNSAGIAVGFADQRAVYWTPEGTAIDLNSLLSPEDDAKWLLQYAYSISDTNWVVGYGSFDPDGPGGLQTYFRAFMMNVGDTDGDGILDDWERNGVPFSKADGTLGRYILPNANPLKKDIYVEVDAMTDRSPAAATLQRVVDAFDPSDRVLVPAIAGLSNALPNVALHVEIDASDQDIPRHPYTDPYCITCLAPWREFDLDKNGVSHGFGTDAERADSDAAAKLAAKRSVYRYCIFADRFFFDPASPNATGLSSGVARGIPSADFMVTLGAVDGGTPEQQAATFMHELGHTLGLGHGGGNGDISTVEIRDRTFRQRDVNFKPNYYSIMNYWWQFPHRWQNLEPPYNGTAWGLRYSESSLPDLDEARLNESHGLGAHIPGARVPFSIPSQVCLGDLPGEYLDRSGAFRFASLDSGRGVDWNGDCIDQTSGFVSASVNEMFEVDRGVFDTWHNRLGGHHDWANLVYNFRDAPTFAPGAPPENIDCNYTPALMAFMDSLPPPVGICPACPADYDQDGGVTGSDVGSFFAAYESGDSCADVDQDGGITGGDLAHFFAVYEAGGC